MTTKRIKPTAAHWDLDSYKTEYESEEHWMLRRRFMEVHKDKFPEDELVCLAQVFTNIEFMGCKYPAETMRLVGELSQDVAKDFRAKRANRLKRTFVKASDAAEARAKGRSKTQQQQSNQQQQTNQQQQRSAMYNNRRACFGTGEWSADSPTKRSVNLFEGLPFGKLVLHLLGGRSCLRYSAQRVKMDLTEVEKVAVGGKKCVEVLINGRMIATATEDNVKLAKNAAFIKTLTALQQCCYSIKSNPARDKIKIDKSGNKVICGVAKEAVQTVEEKRLDATNKGFKMMQLMGWTGGGLGSKTQGREEPVGYLLKNNRSGLGNETCRLDRAYFTQMLKNYIASEDIRELQFEPTFTKDERAMLHELAGKFNLKSTSHGKGDSRSLVISKKTITDEQILTQVLIHKNPSFCDKYLVQVPTIRAKDFPDNNTKLELDL